MRNQYTQTQEEVKTTLRLNLHSFSNMTLMSGINYNEQLAVKDMQEQMKSYCKVAHKRIMDVLLLQAIERHLVKSVHLFFWHAYRRGRQHHQPSYRVTSKAGATQRIESQGGCIEKKPTGALVYNQASVM